LPTTEAAKASADAKTQAEHHQNGGEKLEAAGNTAQAA
jgi:hypothetical protein